MCHRQVTVYMRSIDGTCRVLANFLYTPRKCKCQSAKIIQYFPVTCLWTSFQHNMLPTAITTKANKTFVQRELLNHTKRTFYMMICLLHTNSSFTRPFPNVRIDSKRKTYFAKTNHTFACRCQTNKDVLNNYDLCHERQLHK